MSDTKHPKHSLSMADVADKPVTYRLALASGRITVGEKAFALLRDKSLPKDCAYAIQLNSWRTVYLSLFCDYPAFNGVIIKEEV